MNSDWLEYNQKYLTAKIREMREKLVLYLENKNNNVGEQDNKDTDSNPIVNSGFNQNQIGDTSFLDMLLDNEKKEGKQIFASKNLSEGTGSNSVSSNYDFIPAIDILSKAFNLSEFEKNMVLLCAAVELDSETSILCSKIHGNNGNTMGRYVTFALGFTIFLNGHWSALLPNSPLRHFQILKIMNLNSTTPLVFLPIMINEQVLHFLVGLVYSDTDTSGIIHYPSKLVSLEVEKIVNDRTLNYYRYNIDRVLRLCDAKTKKNTSDGYIKTNSYHVEKNSLSLIILTGGDEIDGLIIIKKVCGKLGLQLKYLEAESLPSKNEELQQLIQNWTRDAMLLGMGLMISYKNSGEIESQNQIIQSLKIFVENIHVPVFLHISQMLDLARPYAIINLKKPSKSEQIHIWKRFLKNLFKIYKIAEDREKDQIIKTIANQFDFTSSEIFGVCKNVFDENHLSKSKKLLHTSLWDESIEISKPKVGNLGIMIPSSTSSSSTSGSSLSSLSRGPTLDDIVLPSHEKELLRTILIHCRYRDKVYREWGFEEKSRGQGLGITVLFSGPSGTGKTMAAEILSSELKLSMLKIDLSQVISKYIGETEKNLDKIFNSAQKGGAAIVIDEADALFAKRTEVKDSHDRYANIETSFLLQRMESYNGLAILTTNKPRDLDNAFLRRLKFSVKFPAPDEESRLQIWTKTFPRDTPLGVLDFRNLAKLKLTGGNIRNICLNASFFAAHDDLPVGRTHITKALQIEYSKTGQDLTNTDLFI